MITSRFKVMLAEKELREKRSISLRRVVRETGVPISTVIGLANNTLKEFPGEAVAILCRYLDCSLSDLLQVIDEESTMSDDTQKPAMEAVLA